MKCGAKVFVVTQINALEATIKFLISHRGVVTGYDVSFVSVESVPQLTKIAKKNVFATEVDAKKALFKRKLKQDEEILVPAEDKKGDRHWITDHKRGMRR